jgi:hypothetical protein
MSLVVVVMLLGFSPQEAGPPAPRNRPAQTAPAQSEPAKVAIPEENPSGDVPSATEAGTRPDFSGTWKRNPQLSESLIEKIQKARASERSRPGEAGGERSPGGWGGGHGGGRGPGGPGRGMGHGGSGGGPSAGGRGTGSGSPGGDRDASAGPIEMLRDLADPSETLTVKHQEPEIAIVDDTARLLRLYTDSRKSKPEDGRAEIVTRWVGDVVESERTMANGRKVRFTYAASTDRKRLFVTTHVGLRSGEVVDARTVYDLVSPR